MDNILKVSTAKNIMVLMVQAADHVSGAAGLTLVISASKDGGAFGTITPTVTERGNGWYVLSLTTAHTDTFGTLAIHISATGADPSDLKYEVVAFDMASSTSLGLSNLDAQSSLIKAKTDNIGATVALETGGNIAAVKAKTDNLPSDPADESLLEAAIATRAPEAGGNVAAIKAKTDLIGASVALETGGNLAAVKAKTDNLPAAPANEVVLDEVRRLLKNKLVIDTATSKLKLYNDAGDTVILSWDVTDKDGNPVVLTGTAPANRGVPT